MMIKFLQNENHLKEQGERSRSTNVILSLAFVRLGQNTRPHFPIYGTWGLAFVLYGAFVFHASSISKRVSDQKAIHPPGPKTVKA
jgi:hypothetical protein